MPRKKKFEGNAIEPHIKDYEDDVNTLCEIRVKLTQNNKTEPWDQHGRSVDSTLTIGEG